MLFAFFRAGLDVRRIMYIKFIELDGDEVLGRTTKHEGPLAENLGDKA